MEANLLFSHHGLPTPPILEYNFGTEEVPEYLVVGKMIGEHPVLAKNTQRERDKIHSSAGETLRRIHNIKIMGFGRLDFQMTGENQTWLDFMDKFFDESIGRVKKTGELYDTFGKKLETEYANGRGDW